MSNRKTPLIALVLVCVLAVTAGLGVSVWHASRQPSGPAPAFTLTDLSGQQRPSSEWQGKLLLVNFWASWCTPCLEEIPLLVEAQARYGARGLQIIGPAMDEPEPIKAMVQRFRINYPVSANLNETDASSRALGNTQGGLPYSVLISRDGHVLKTVLGSLSREQLEDLIEKHL
jgi:thiol-disulfide isomerase/thioredoxin